MNFPEIISCNQSSNSLILDIFVDANLNAFKGHFDDAPILPGVVQIGWAIEFAKRYLGLSPGAQVARMDALKFQHVILPNTRVKLEILLEDSKLIFKYQSDEKKHSSGKLIVGG